MENDLDLVREEPIVIEDECGDSMWDAVLEQDVEACDVETISKNTPSLLPDNDTE